MKKVAFLGTEGGVSVSSVGLDKAHALMGENTGNFIFQYSVWRSIKNPKSSFPILYNPDYIKENFDIVILPAANQINPKWDLGLWADYFDYLNLPLIVVGLGAQLSSINDTDISLKEGTIKFLKVIGKKSKLIGVRGEFTKKIMEKFDIYNTVVVGCPSNFINKNINGYKIQKNINKCLHCKLDEIKAFYNFGTMEEYVRGYEKILFNFAKSINANIIYQTDLRKFKLLYYKKVNEDIKNYLIWEKGVLAPDMEINDYIQLILDKGKFYSHAMQWIDDAGLVDMVFGMRIHGAIAAIQGGGLGICVTFDSRTLELVKTMGYPYIEATQLNANENLSTFINKINFDGDLFDEKRKKLYSDYKNIFYKNEIEINEELIW